MTGDSSFMRSKGGAISELLLIGPPDSRRIAAMKDAACRLGLSTVSIRSYLDLLQSDFAPPRPGALVRLESPGGCFETTRAFLRAGRPAMEAEGGMPVSAAEIDRLECVRGEMLHPRQWFLGFREVLGALHAAWNGLDLRWMSTCPSIVTAFDKAACLDLWSESGLPIPRQYPDLSSYSEIRRAIRDAHARVFVKLRYGYSAMGAVALEWRGDRVRAVTTMRSDRSTSRPRLFVTKCHQLLQHESEIAWLVDTLGKEQIIVENWLPKSRWENRPYDLRVVMIHGEVGHVVGRARASPFTNLNLDARRMPRDVVEQQIRARWPEFESLCKRGASVVPGAGMLGLDVLASPGCRTFTLLEANAFGDYLPGVLHRGQSTYEAQIRAEHISPTGLCR